MPAVLTAPAQTNRLADLLLAHRFRVMRVTEGRGLAPLRSLYERARSDLRERLASLLTGKKGKTFDAYNARVALAQIEEFMRAFSGDMARHMDASTVDAQRLSLEDLTGQVYLLEPKFRGAGAPLAVEEAAVFEGIIGGARPIIRHRLEEGVGHYSARAVTRMERSMAMSILQNKTIDDAVGDLVDQTGAFESERWRAERIVRTEMANAYEYTKHQGMIETERRDLPGMKRQIVAIFDNRTGEDSKLINGQVVDMDEPFYDPVQKKYYMNPPNRPNDRETVIPFHPDWGMAFGQRVARLAKK